MPAAAVKSCSSKTKKAGLQFPVGRLLCMFKKGNFAPRTVGGSAVFNDDEPKVLLRNVTISRGGVLPYIIPVLLPKKPSSKM